MADDVQLRITPEELEVEAGAEVEAVATVVNRGQVVDQYALVVEGLEEGWYELSPSSVSLFPQDQAQVKLVLRPPMATETKAGEHPFKLVAVSQDNPERRAEIGLSLQVRAFGGLGMEVAPGRVEGRSGSYRVVLRNGGNADSRLVLRGVDPEEGLDYRFAGFKGGEPAEVVVPAGGQTEVGVVVRPKRGPLVGGLRDHDFRIEARAPGIEGEVAEPLVGMAQLGYKPMLRGLPFGGLPVWAQRALMVIVPLLIIGLVAAALMNRGGESPATPTPLAKVTSPTSTPLPTPASVDKVGASAKPSGPPVVREFAFTSVSEGGRDVLGVEWQVENADTVELDGGKVDPTGKEPVDPVENRELVLLAKNKSGEITQKLGLVLIRRPRIISFKAEPPEVKDGEATRISYEVWGADEVLFDGKPVDPRRGETELVPSDTGMHGLVARNAVGEVVREIEIRVLPKE